ncbi:MAG TPA: signal peptidase II [Spirochaetota bacterium]|nr:signal peptidase II [Spirochaetota bacterium]
MIKNIKKYSVTLSVCMAALAADILTKYLVNTRINLYERIDLIGSFVQLTKLYNKGGIFGILQGYQKLFLIFSIIVLCIMIALYVYEKNKTMLFSISMGLIFSGALGNILDRLIGRPGVVDFIYIGVDRIYRWPAFNVADCSIVVGAIMLLIFFYTQGRDKKA